MNYELAKELKDVGFPQDSYRRNGEPSTRLGQLNGNQDEVKFSEQCIAPTLSELIDECGDSFQLLRKSTRLVDIDCIGDCWRAEGLWAEPNDILSVEGSNPEEAVARLWLALNKKP